jgi:hypothetical protein
MLALAIVVCLAVCLAVGTNSSLPSWWEWGNIGLFTRSQDWTGPQWEMMRKASRYHALRLFFLAVLMGLLTGIGLLVGRFVL